MRLLHDTGFDRRAADLSAPHNAKSQLNAGFFTVALKLPKFPPRALAAYAVNL
jgi:hypothetical protein